MKGPTYRAERQGQAGRGWRARGHVGVGCVRQVEDTRHRSLDASEETKRGVRVPCPVDKSRLAPGSEGRQAGGRGRQQVRFRSCLRGQGTGDWVRGSS